MSTRIGEHAIVLGGSVAGMLAARVLSQSYARVTVIEPDTLRVTPCHRRGVPQSRHVHGVLPLGRELLDDLFDGLTSELAAAGALTGDARANVLYIYSGYLLARGPSGSKGLFLSRPLLGARLRARIRRIPTVSVLDGHDAPGLVTMPGSRRVAGVRVMRRADAGSELTLPADLVMGATGRGSRLPAWLPQMGIPRPQRDKVEAGATPAGSSGCARARSGTTA